MRRLFSQKFSTRICTHTWIHEYPSIHSSTNKNGFPLTLTQPTSSCLEAQVFEGAWICYQNYEKYSQNNKEKREDTIKRI